MAACIPAFRAMRDATQCRRADSFRRATERRAYDMVRSHAAETGAGDRLGHLHLVHGAGCRRWRDRLHDHLHRSRSPAARSRSSGSSASPRPLRPADAELVPGLEAGDILFIDFEPHHAAGHGRATSSSTSMFPELAPAWCCTCTTSSCPEAIRTEWEMPRMYSEQNALVGWLILGLLRRAVRRATTLATPPRPGVERAGRGLFAPLRTQPAGSIWHAALGPVRGRGGVTTAVDRASPPAIELVGISKSFGPVQANKDIDLRGRQAARSTASSARTAPASRR